MVGNSNLGKSTEPLKFPQLRAALKNEIAAALSQKDTKRPRGKQEDLFRMEVYIGIIDCRLHRSGNLDIDRSAFKKLTLFKS
jgi:hypothetical protein